MNQRLIVIPFLLAACGRAEVEDTELQRLSEAATRTAPQQSAVVEASSDEAGADDTAAEVAQLEPAEGEPLDGEVAEVPEAHPVPEAARFTLRRGETPSHFARWSGLPVEVVAEASGLDLGGVYPVGTDIRVPVTGEARAALENARQAHHVRRAEGYLASRGGAVRTEFYTVKTGDSAWTIADACQGIPVWLLESYNPSVNLERLRPGQELMVPVLGDTVADAGLP